MDNGKIHHGEGIFYIELGEATSFAAYPINKSKKLDGKGEKKREHFLATKVMNDNL